MNGHLGLSDLKKQEGLIFGNTEQRSSFSMHIKDIDVELVNKPLLPHKSFTAPCIKEGGRFTVVFRLLKSVSDWNVQQLQNLFELVSYLGGIGRRVRRGMGCFRIDGQVPLSLEVLHAKMQSIAPYFTIRNKQIQSKFPRNEDYPYIESVELGLGDVNLLLKISKTTHRLRRDRGYTSSMGFVKGKQRLASPVYVSVIKDKGLRPVITTLKSVQEKRYYRPDRSLQQQFKKAIL